MRVRSPAEEPSRDQGRKETPDRREGEAVREVTMPAEGDEWVAGGADEDVEVRAFTSEQAREGGILVVGQIKHDLEQALGRPMSLSSVYTLLHRHDWRKLAPDKLVGKTISLEQSIDALVNMDRFETAGVTVVTQF